MTGCEVVCKVCRLYRERELAFRLMSAEHFFFAGTFCSVPGDIQRKLEEMQRRSASYNLQA